MDPGRYIIIYVHDLINNEGNFTSLAEFNQKYGNDQANFVQYLGVIEAIKNFMSKNAVVKEILGAHLKVRCGYFC